MEILHLMTVRSVSFAELPDKTQPAAEGCVQGEQKGKTRLSAILFT